MWRRKMLGLKKLILLNVEGNHHQFLRWDLSLGLEECQNVVKVEDLIQFVKKFLTGIFGKIYGSNIIWSFKFFDLVLNKPCSKWKSKWISWKVTKFSRSELALWRNLLLVWLSVLGVFLKIFSGLSTIVGGFGSGWDLVDIILRASA